jgi:hypothetical protein
MGKEQILQAEGDDLAMMAGKMLIGNHTPTLYGPYDDPPSTSISCQNCHQIRQDVTASDRKDFWNESCYIAITPANAFKWRDWAVEKYGATVFWNAMDAVFTMEWATYKNSKDFNRKYVSTPSWAMVYAQPKHYVKAAMLCKEQSNG